MLAALAAGLAGPATVAQAQVGPHGSLPEGLTCRACHDIPNFLPVREDMDFEHAEVAGFALEGAHAGVECRSCHLDLRFTETNIVPQDCGSCHANLHQSRFVDPCVTCHQPTSFRDVSGLEVHARTSFPLVGAHLQITCEACHATDEAGGAFAAQDPECISCHQEDYRSSWVDHVGNDFPTECTGCHSVLGFADGLSFPHYSSGTFTLSGPHTTLACDNCHTVPGLAVLVSAASPQDCISCHQADYDAQHAGSPFPTVCLTCHSGEAWENPDVDHGAVAGFMLVPPHDALDCSACHEGTAYTLRFPTPTNSADCGACHQASDHSTLFTDFELVGAHAVADCTACHVSGTMTLKFPVPASAEDCVTCHLADFEAEHLPSWSRNCAACHNRTSWAGTALPVAPPQPVGTRRAP